MTSKPRAIGVVSPQFSGDYFGTLLAGIYSVTRRYTPRLIAIQGTPRSTFPNRLSWDCVDGWIIINDTDGLAQFAPPGMPLVTIGAQEPALACPAVFPDNHGGMRAAVRHLIGHGHQRIGFVGNLAHNDVRQRYEGYLAALADHSLAAEPALVATVPDASEHSGAEGFRHLSATGTLPTALVAGTDENALGVLAAAQAAGCRVPEDLAVVGFDDIILAHASIPPLTTTKLPIRALGSTAAELLLARLAGQATPQGAVYVQTALIPRHSCGCSMAALAPSVDGDHPSSWEAALEQQFVQLARYPLPPDPAIHLQQIWPAGATLIDGLASALEARATPSAAQLHQAWHELIAVTENLEVLRAIVAALAEAGARELGARPTAISRTSVDEFVERAGMEMIRARLALETNLIRGYSTLVHQNHEIGLTLLAQENTQAQGLEWLARTPLRWGCLGRWDGAEHGQAALTIAGVYQRDAASGAGHPIGTRHAAPAFPPAELLPHPDTAADGELLVQLPISTGEHAYGLLALACPIAYLRASGNYDILTALATLLGTALERAALNETLRNAYERERALADIVRELGSPVIPLLPGVMLVPLVGAIDSSRAQQIITAILQGVSEQQADAVLIDITGVPVVDTQVANSLLQAARAATLLGARVILVGVRPEIAQSIVGLGVELRGISTRPTLAAAVQALLKERQAAHTKNLG